MLIPDDPLGTGRQGDREERAKAVALAALCVASFMVVLDTSIVNLALPSIGRDLGIEPETLTWVLTSYALTTGGFLLVAGRAADLFGRRRVFLAGLALFGIGSLLGGLAVAPWMLVAARIVQGLGGALLTPASLALVSTSFSGPARDRAMGVYGAVGSIGFTVGAGVGGLVTELLDWRWVFWVNVPVALVVFLVTPAVVPESRDVSAHRALDLPGAVTVTAGLAGLIYALSLVGNEGWASPHALALLAASLLLLAGFAAIEHYSPSPLLPLAIFRNRTFAAANAVAMLNASVGIARLYVLTLYFQEVRRYSPVEAGLLLLPMGIVSTAAGLTAGRLVGRVGGAVRVLALGQLFLTVGLLLMSAMSATGGIGIVLAGTVVDAIGFLSAGVAVAIVATAGLGDDRQGLAAGVLVTSRLLGGAWGVGAIAAVIDAGVNASDGGGQGSEALLHGLRYGLLTSAALVGASLVLTLLFLRNGESRIEPGLTR